MATRSRRNDTIAISDSTRKTTNELLTPTPTYGKEARLIADAVPVSNRLTTELAMIVLRELESLDRPLNDAKQQAKSELRRKLNIWKRNRNRSNSN